MSPKIHPIFSQDLDNGQTGEFGIGEDGKAYWNGKPIVTEESSAPAMGQYSSHRDGPRSGRANDFRWTCLLGHSQGNPESSALCRS